MDIRDWKMLQIVVSAPLFLLLLLYFVLPESPRWLIATGRYKEAKELIEKAAKMNKVSNSLRAIWGYSLNASNIFLQNSVVSAPLFLLLLLFFVLSESPRWLIAAGRYKEAKELIQKAAKIGFFKGQLGLFTECVQVFS